MPLPRISLFFALALIGLATAIGSPEMDYRRPSPEIARIAEKPWLPLYNPDPTRRHLLRLNLEGLVPMDRLSREEINLAGLRIFADSRSRSRQIYANALSLVEIATGRENEVGTIPPDSAILNAQWSPNGEHLALLIEKHSKVNLWRVAVSTGEADLWSDLPVHAGLIQTLDWSSDSQSVWIKTIPASLGPRPGRPVTPSGVVVRQTTGEALPAQTYQGLLKTRFDIDQFEYFFTSQMTRVFLDGTLQTVGTPGIYRSFSDSPDQNYLLVERLVKPWSYLVTEEQFAYDLEVWDLNTLAISRLVSTPLAEGLPYSGGLVRTGAREFKWRSDAPATVAWVEAQDNGNSYQPAKLRDIVFASDAPFDSEPRELLELKDRYSDLLWHRDDLAILVSWNWKDRRINLSSIDPSSPGKNPRRLTSFRMGDRYRHPGYPLLSYNEQGFHVIHSDISGENMYLLGEGGSEKGNRPFIDQFNVKTKRKQRIFQSKAPFLEYPVTIMDTGTMEVLVRRETKTTPPAFFLWNSKEKFHTQVTHDKNPLPELANVSRQLLRYKRSDGVSLTANLYLPEGYNPEKDGPLPTLVWAYPKAYRNAENASQLKKSPYRFIRGQWQEPVIWTLRGYAVLDDPSMPIIAKGDHEPNDSFVEQLVNSADAAVRELLRLGVSEEGKIALGGHSYGAFMTANLLAFTDLFCAGIARNGAYNRTLTPFGFQSEERNLWQAPRVYLETSPFLNVPNINEPLLLFHGEKDHNPGTYPMQSERLFHAINGIGGQARLVLFPNEGHSYRGLDSVMHMLWETEQWLDVHVKGETFPQSNSVAVQANHVSTTLVVEGEAAAEGETPDQQ